MTCRWTTEPPSGAYFAWSIQQADPSLAINVHIFDISQLATYGEGILLSDGLFKSNVYSSSFTASESRILQYRSHQSVCDRGPQNGSKAYGNLGNEKGGIELKGYENESSQPIRLVSKCEYDIHGETTQFCKSEYKVEMLERIHSQGEKLFQLFQLVIQDNWGAKYTCLYRFRVHYSVCFRIAGIE